MAVSNDYNHQTVQLVVWCTTQYRVMRGIWCTTKYSMLRGVGCTTQLPLFYYHKQATSTATPNYCKRHISHTDTYSRDTGRHTRYTGPPLQVRAFITIILPTALLRVYINRSMYFIQGGKGRILQYIQQGKQHPTLGMTTSASIFSYTCSLPLNVIKCSSFESVTCNSSEIYL